MKILIVTPFFYPHIGGSQNYMEELYVKLLKAKKGFEVDVLCYNTDRAVELEKYRGLAIYRIPCWNILPGQFALPSPWHLISFLASNINKYQLIHCSTRFFDSSWYMPLVAKIFNKKIWLTDHCASNPRYPNIFVNLIVKIIDDISGRIFLPMYNKVFVVSKATGLFLKEHFKVKSEVMYGGTNFEKLNRSVVKKHKRVKAVYIGRMIPSKGVRNLFEAAGSMKNIDFVLAGPGPLVKTLQNEVKRQKIDHIQVLSGLNKEQVQKTLEEADIFVHPSYHSEGIPIILLEAGIAGLAVVATDMGGSREVVINNKTGLLIKPNDQGELRDALQKLSENGKLRQEFAKNIHRHIQANFSWSKSAEKLEEELNKVS